MKIEFSKSATPLSRSRQSGQTSIFVILVLGLFLLAAVGLAIDYSSVWFHRQAAQAAADAACQAGVMDMLVLANGSTVPSAGFAVGTPFDCNTTPSASPCQYALRNGYNGSSGLTTGSESVGISVSFPTSVDGVTAPPTSVAGANPFMRVDITDRTRMYFSSLLTASSVQDVKAHATCGLQLAHAPIPIIVLNPTCPHAFEVSDSATNLTIMGGPSKSVQVNSSYAVGSDCATAGKSSGCGNGTYQGCSATPPGCKGCQVDLCFGGPNFTGSSFGTYGAAGNPSASFAGGSTGSWVSPSAPIGDPFARTNPPAAPALSSTNGGGSGGAASPKPVAYNVDGCPDKGGCKEYFPGQYTNYIKVQGETAIFVPGIYYMTAFDESANYKGKPSSCMSSAPNKGDAAVAIGSGGVVRPANCAGNICSDGNSYPSGGTMFYFTNNSGGLAVVQSAGAAAKDDCSGNIECFDTNLATCAGGTAPDSRLQLPRFVGGNVLMGQCTNDGTYTTGAANGSIRGLITFQDRSISDPKKQTSFQGTGSLLLAGTVYAHNAGTYQDFIQLQGTPGSGTFVLGEIVTDSLVLSGNASIKMQLNPNAIYYILKASLLE